MFGTNGAWINARNWVDWKRRYFWTFSEVMDTLKKDLDVALGPAPAIPQADGDTTIDWDGREIN
jgi:hypothetical protein